MLTAGKERSLLSNYIDGRYRDFILEVLENVKREGMDSLIDWLKKSTFFTMPSSSRYHGNYAGGLAEHSWNVYLVLSKMCEAYEEQFPEVKFNKDSIAIVSLLHDLCKVDLYKKGYRNVKNEETGEWEKKEVYEHNDTLGMGHGEGSLYILQSFIKLSREEALAIRHHMGAYDAAAKGGDFSINIARSQFPLVTLVHLADMWASQFMEKVV